MGVILYQMLTGTLPYFSPNPAQIERMVAQGRCTPPRDPQQPDPAGDLRHRDEGHRAPSWASATSARRELLDDLATAGEIDHNATAMEDIRKRLKAREVPEEGVLLALPQAAARAVRFLPLLRRDAVDVTR